FAGEVLSELFANEAKGVATTAKNDHRRSNPLHRFAVPLPRKAGEERRAQNARNPRLSRRV
ncbi:MAG TPA: hypothetical protein VGH02_15425, partial [Rhizomicrobium sp.]